MSDSNTHAVRVIQLIYYKLRVPKEHYQTQFETNYFPGFHSTQNPDVLLLRCHLI